MYVYHVHPSLKSRAKDQSIAQLTNPPLATGRSLHCQVEHHVRDKFATVAIYGIDNFKFYDIFSTYTLPLITSFV